MNRQERRKKERKIEKELNVIKKLSPAELNKINEIAHKLAQSRTDEALTILDRSLTGLLVSEGWSFKKIRVLQDKLSEFMVEDQEKIRELEKENVDMAKLQEDVKIFIEGLIKEGKGRKEIVEATMFKFPKLSKTAANNAYGKIQEDLELEDAAAYILEDNKELKKKVKEVKEEKKTEEVKEEEVRPVAKAVVVPIENDDLEILEEEVVRTLKIKGNNGLYTAKTGLGVSLENEGYKLAFSNREDLQVFYNEYIKVFDRI